MKTSGCCKYSTCLHARAPSPFQTAITQAFEKHGYEHTDLKRVMYTKYRSSSVLGTLRAFVVCLVFSCSMPVSLNQYCADTAPNKLVKNSLCDSDKIKRKKKNKISCVGRLGNVLAMKMQIVYCCC